MNEPKALPLIYRDLTVRIPGRPPTANARRHWRSIARDNEAWKLTSCALALADRHDWEARHGLKWSPLRRAQLAVEFGVATLAVRDWDNLIGSIKPLLDGIVKAGILLDDSIRVIAAITFTVRYSKGDPYTEFQIVEDAE